MSAIEPNKALPLAASLLLCWAADALADKAALTPERAVDYRRAQDLHFSPDGSQLAYALFGFWSESWGSRVWVLDLKSGRSHPLLPPAGTQSSPEWSTAGRVRYLASHEGVTQVFQVPASGGTPQAQTASVASVVSFRGSADGKLIAYLAAEGSCKSGENAPQVADQECNLPRLWIVEAATGVKRQLTRGRWRIDEYAWLDAKHLIVKATDEPFREQFTGAVYRITVLDGRLELVSRPALPFAELAPSPDGRQLALTSTRSGGPIPHDLYLQGLPRGALRDLSATLDRYVAAVRWQNRQTLWVQATDGFINRLYAVHGAGAPRKLELPGSVWTFDVAPDGRIAFEGTDFNRLPEIYLRESDGRIRQLTHLQQGWDDLRLAGAEYFRTRSFDGLPIEAALLRPQARDPSGSSPLVLLVHGGPASNFGAAYFWFMSWAQLLVERGYQVLLVNPRGSIGYGEEFLKANRGDWGGGDYRDLMEVLDALIARGETDPKRLGIGGWSYGAEMSGWAIGHSDRFRAAVGGGGVYEQATEFGTESNSADDEWYFGKPWEHPQVFTRNSPMTFVRDVHTPMLLLHGELDHNNPIAQSQIMYRALKSLGVESVFVTYPGEPHLPRQRSHQVDVLERMLAWYDAHLKAP